MPTLISTAIVLVMLNVVAVEASVPITVFNQCRKSIELFDSSVVETVVSGGSTTRTLSQGYSGTLRNGVNSQATLAELSVGDGYFMYSISIIPIGVIDPGCCTSLKECKAVTGTTGYNTPIQISPAGCTNVTCLEDGCVDAYHFPTDNTKAHKCTNPTSVVVTFCPGGTAGSSQQQQQQPSAYLPTPAPTQPPAFAPTMEASSPISTIEAHYQLQTETSVPVVNASKSTTVTLTETPSITPVTSVDAKVKSCDGGYENVTVLPKMESKTKTLGSTTATADIAAGTASTTTKAPTVDVPTTLTGSKSKTDTATATLASTTQTVSPLSSNIIEENTQSANTQSSVDDGISASTYVGTGLGFMAVVAIVAVVVVSHKKKEKEKVDETEENEFSQEDVMTPVTRINVL